jgi:hypothetical protein
MTKYKRKQKRVWREEEVPKIWRWFYKPGPDGVQYIPVVARGWWIHDWRTRFPDWIDAFERLDKFGEEKPLKTLLKDRSRELPDEVRYYLLPDLIDRGIPRKHKPGTPIYELTETEEVLIRAAMLVRYYQKSPDWRLNFEDALEKAVTDWNANNWRPVHKSTLRDFCRKTGGVYLALKKRWKPLSTINPRG